MSVNLPISARSLDRFIPPEYDIDGAKRLADEAAAAVDAAPDDGARRQAEIARDAAEAFATAVRDRLDALGRPPPLFFLQPATYLQRGDFQAMLIEKSADFPGNAALYDSLIAAVNKVVIPEDRPPLLEGLQRARLLETLEPELAELVNRIEEQVGPHWTSYQRLLAKRQRWLRRAPYHAVQFFARGWEHLYDADDEAIPFERYMDLVPDRVMERIPDDLVETVGLRAMALMTIAAAQRKNSKSRSPSASSPPPSPAGRTPSTAADGRSSELSTAQTQGSA